MVTALIRWRLSLISTGSSGSYAASDDVTVWTTAILEIVQIHSCSVDCATVLYFVLYFYTYIHYIIQKYTVVVVESACPKEGCDGRLTIQKCSGNRGFPVTHFWRTEGQTIYFEAKGSHDHPAPDQRWTRNGLVSTSPASRLSQVCQCAFIWCTHY